MIAQIKTRLAARLSGETYDQNLVDELAQEVIDRLALRLGVTEATFPPIFYSIAVDASIKAFRRVYYEGISHETVSSISDSFVSDILAEYEDEIGAWLATDDAKDSTSRTRVKFF